MRRVPQNAVQRMLEVMDTDRASQTEPIGSWPPAAQGCGKRVTNIPGYNRITQIDHAAVVSTGTIAAAHKFVLKSDRPAVPDRSARLSMHSR